MNALLRFTVMMAAMLCTTAHAEPYTFALIGDTPYNESERQALPKMLDALSRQDFAFIIHDGDFKDGRTPCTDALFADRHEMFNKTAQPLIFVPGDNEWTDCHRFTAGGFDPVERLNKLRAMFFASPRPLGGKPFTMESQSKEPAFAAYREHLRWTRGGVVFVTLNVPGSDNNIVSFEKPSAEYLERSQAVSSWIAESFAQAKQKSARGIVFVFQANLEFGAFNKGKPNRAYRELITQFARESAAFSGRVLLVHGDSHQLTIDQPLRHPTTGATLENVTRIETYGHPFMGWVRVGVDERRPDVFTIQAVPWSAP